MSGEATDVGEYVGKNKLPVKVGDPKTYTEKTEVKIEMK